MTIRRQARKQLVVGNPRNVPPGVPILSFQDRYWYEGDDWVKPKDMAEESETNWIARGFIVEAKAAAPAVLVAPNEEE